MRIAVSERFPPHLWLTGVQAGIRGGLKRKTKEQRPDPGMGVVVIQITLKQKHKPSALPDS